MTPPATFVAAPDPVAGAVEFPEVVAAFESLGFRRLGRLGRAVPGQVWRWAASYPRPHRDDFAAHVLVPPVVLLAPDAATFVSVGWWWGMPDVRLRTTLVDGSVVETLRQWDRMPVPPRAHQRIYQRGDLTEEQLLQNNPEGGRDVALASGSPEELWLAHEDHVGSVAERRRTTPVEQSSIDEAVALANRLARHQEACRRAQVRRGLLILLVIGLGAAAVVVAAVTLPLVGMLFLLLGELLAIGALLLLRRRIWSGSLQRRYRVAGRPTLGP